LLALAKTASDQGHRVTFCTHPPFAEVIVDCGLKFVPLGTADDYFITVKDPAMWNSRTSYRAISSSVAWTTRVVFDTLEAEADDDTVIAAHQVAFGARLFHEKYNVPLLSLQVSPAGFISAQEPPVLRPVCVPRSLPLPLRKSLTWAMERFILDPLFAPELNRFRATLGLPPLKRIMSSWSHSPQGIIGLYPNWFAPIQRDWPKNLTLTGFTLFDQAGVRGIDTEVEDFLASGSPPIVFTPGSSYVDRAAFYTAATTALKALGLRGIFLASDGETLPKSTSNILERSYIPLSTLLPRVRALVHHGGIGTAALAYAAGIPQLITPYAFDQFDNAARVERTGCGFSIKALPNGTRMTESIKRLLNDRLIGEKCIEYQLLTESGENVCRKALTALESFAGERGRSFGHLSSRRGL
jgi:rhamnosyltransferase subunit B